MCSAYCSGVRARVSSVGSGFRTPAKGPVACLTQWCQWCQWCQISQLPYSSDLTHSVSWLRSVMLVSISGHNSVPTMCCASRHLQPLGPGSHLGLGLCRGRRAGVCMCGHVWPRAHARSTATRYTSHPSRLEAECSIISSPPCSIISTPIQQHTAPRQPDRNPWDGWVGLKMCSAYCSGVRARVSSVGSGFRTPAKGPVACLTQWCQWCQWCQISQLPYSSDLTHSVSWLRSVMLVSISGHNSVPTMCCASRHLQPLGPGSHLGLGLCRGRRAGVCMCGHVWPRAHARSTAMPPPAGRPDV